MTRAAGSPPRRPASPLRAALLAALLAACRIGGVEPAPLVGPEPAAIAVWPWALGERAAPDRVVLTGLETNLGRRGYRVLAPAVAAELLTDAGLGAATADWGAVGRALNVDAVLQMDVRQLSLESDDWLESARWDLAWRLVSTRGAGAQWTFEHHGNWRRRSREPGDALRPLDAEPDIVPIGGDRTPNFRDAPDLFAWLNRFAMDHLPRADS